MIFTKRPCKRCSNKILHFKFWNRQKKRKKWEVNGLIKDELGGQIMKDFFVLRAKRYSYLKENNDEDKKAKGRKSASLKESLNKLQESFIQSFLINRSVNY